MFSKMTDRLIDDVQRKLEREKQFIENARKMRNATDNPAVQSRVDNEIRGLQKNLMYLEEKMRELHMRQSQQGGGMDIIFLI